MDHIDGIYCHFREKDTLYRVVRDPGGADELLVAVNGGTFDEAERQLIHYHFDPALLCMRECRRELHM